MLVGTFATTRSAEVGPAARPVAIPDDLDASRALTTGVVELPLRARWSSPPRSYDLAVRQDRILVYEQVMVEGADEDVRRFIDVDEVVGDVGRRGAAPARSAGVGDVAAGAAQSDAVVLSALQERVARIVAALPEAEQFALAGGVPLVVARTWWIARPVISTTSGRRPLR